MVTSRTTLRQDILKRLYPTLRTKSTTLGVGNSTTLKDSSLLRGVVPSETYIGAWVYILEDSSFGVELGDITRVVDLVIDIDAWNFTVSPSVWLAITGGVDYEIHYVFHPEDIHDVINDVIRFGTRSTLSSLTADTDTTVFERDVLVNGALSILKRRLAVGKNASEAANLNVESQIHERDYLLGLVRQGYEPMTRVKEINVSN